MRLDLEKRSFRSFAIGRWDQEADRNMNAIMTRSYEAPEGLESLHATVGADPDTNQPNILDMVLDMQGEVLGK